MAPVIFPAIQLNQKCQEFNLLFLLIWEFLIKRLLIPCEKIKKIIGPNFLIQDEVD